MSATPETDKAERMAFLNEYMVPTEFARKLERERNKAAEDATNYYARLGEVEKERDEAIADRDIARLSAQDSDKAHDRMVGELEKVYKERDDAVAECKSLWSLVNANKLRAYKAERERDEAREQIEVCRGIIDRTVIARNSALSELTVMERDCDEARAVIRMLWERAETFLDLSEEEIERVNRSWGESK